MSTASGTLTGPILVGVFLDYAFGWSPWGVLGGLALGFIGCMMYLVQQAKEK
ncbi:hypothetical protein KIH39_26310 [Telmatocola sphagniphila]|uniref:Uncharacterized protein n=1 Tax=Telmatocola sphagniphila TaxID=1123043 RepID=A0A8E6EY47_9BACT|nr:hypothetical protein [Telmatocola sphagniphila]QVL32303.1 hypothetical protein KIH39_26310 [Telmatocola sphagniphila]